MGLVEPHRALRNDWCCCGCNRTHVRERNFAYENLLRPIIYIYIYYNNNNILSVLYSLSGYIYIIIYIMDYNTLMDIYLVYDIEYYNTLMVLYIIYDLVYYILLMDI